MHIQAGPVLSILEWSPLSPFASETALGGTTL